MSTLPWAPSGGGLPWGPSAGGTPGGAPGLTPEQLLRYQKQLAAARLAQQPQPQGRGGVGGFVGGALDAITPDVVGLALRQIGESLLYTPAGMLQLGKAFVQDSPAGSLWDLAHGNIRDAIIPEHLGGMGIAMGQQVVQDFLHPLRNPGYLAMDLATIASGGALAGERLGLISGELAQLSTARGVARAAQAQVARRRAPLLSPDAPLPPRPGPAGTADVPVPGALTSPVAPASPFAASFPSQLALGPGTPETAPLTGAAALPQMTARVVRGQTVAETGRSPLAPGPSAVPAQTAQAVRQETVTSSALGQAAAAMNEAQRTFQVTPGGEVSRTMPQQRPIVPRPGLPEGLPTASRQGFPPGSPIPGVADDVMRTLARREPINAASNRGRTILAKLDFLAQRGFTASVEDGVIRLHGPGEPGGEPLVKTVLAANASEQVYKGAASETLQGHAAAVQQVVKERLDADRAAWAEANPGKPFPPMNPLVTDATIAELAAAERITTIPGARALPDEIDFEAMQTAAREGGGAPLSVADETTGRRAELTPKQQEAADKRMVARRRKLAKDAGFPNNAAAARAMGKIGATPMTPEAEAMIRAQRHEADALANIKNPRITSRNPRELTRIDRPGDEFPIVDPLTGELTPRQGYGPSQRPPDGGHIYVDRKPSGVVWRRDPQNPNEWQVLAEDRPKFSSKDEITKAATAWLQKDGVPLGKKQKFEEMRDMVDERYPGGYDEFLRDHGLQRDITVTNAKDAYRLARLDAAEKMIQKIPPGFRSLDIPEIPNMHIGGKPISARAAVEMGNKVLADEKAAGRALEAEVKKTKDAEAAQLQSEREERQRKAQEIEAKKTDPNAPLAPETQEVLRADAPEEIHADLERAGIIETSGPKLEDLQDQIEADLPSDEAFQAMERQPGVDLSSDEELAALAREAEGTAQPLDQSLFGPEDVVNENDDWRPNPDAPQSAIIESDPVTGEIVKPEDFRPEPPSPEGGVPVERPPGPGPGRPSSQASPETIAEVSKAISEAPPVVPAGRRGSGTGVRDIKSDKANLERVLGNTEEAARLSPILTKALRDAGVTKDSQPSAFKQVYRDALGMSEAAADEFYDRIFMAPKPKIVPSREIQGSWRQIVEKILGKEAYTAEQFDDFATRTKPKLQAEFSRQGGARPDEVKRILIEEFGEEHGLAVYDKAYKKISGGSEIPSVSKVFLRALFKPIPRQKMTLARPGWEEITASTYARLRRENPEAVRTERGADRRETRRFRRGVVGTETTPDVKYFRSTTRTTQANLPINPIRRGFNRWLYDYGVNRAPQYSSDLSRGQRLRSRYAERKFEFEFQERSRLQDYMNPERKGAIAAGAEAAREGTPESVPKAKGLSSWVDSANQLATLLTLYMKPGYIPPNMLGQILFSTIDVAWNPIALARSFKFHREMKANKFGDELTEKLHEALGTGMYESIRPDTGAIAGLSRATGSIARFYGKYMDTPFREAAFYNEAYRAGFRNLSEIERLLKANPGEALYEDLVTVAQNANRNLVDYSRLSANEKKYIRRVVFFYPWIKGSTMYTARFASEHPFQFGAATQSARIGQAQAEETLGQVPSYLKGIVPLGGHTKVPGLGNLPNVSNPMALSIFGSAGQAINAARGFAFGDTRAGEQLSEYFTPAVTAAIAATTKVDPFTGARYPADKGPLGILGQELYETSAWARLLGKLGQARAIASGAEDQGTTGKRLFPATPAQELESFFFGGFMPRAYNAAEGQQRAAAEELGLQSKVKQTQIKWDERTRVVNEEAARLGLSVPNNVQEALATKAERAAGYDQFASSLGKKEGDLSAIERLQSDVMLIVRRGRMSEDQARRLLLRYSTSDPDSITSVRTKLARQYLGQRSLTQFKSRLLRTRGVDPTLVDLDF